MRLARVLSAAFLLALAVPGYAKNLSSITLNPPATGSGLTGNTGTIQITPVCGYDDNSSDNCTASGITLTWAVADSSVGSVNSSGLFTSSLVGSTYAGTAVLAYAASAYPGAQNGYVYGTRSVRVNYAPGTLGITVGFTTGSGSSHIVVGSNGLLAAFDNLSQIISSFYYGNANDAVAWASASPSIATVNNLGEVTGVSAGDSVITAKVSGLTASFTVHITSPTLDSNTYYVRTAGSDSCTGLVNVDFTSGTACAWATINHATATAGSGSEIVATGSFTLSTSIQPASGTPAHPTKIYGACVIAANCTTDPYSAGNRTILITGATDAFSLPERQYMDIEGFDESSGWECTSNAGSWFPNPCPSGAKVKGVIFDQLSAHNTFRYMRIHGYMDGTTGTQGPGNQWIDSALVQNYHTGFNADDPFGAVGVMADGNTFTRVTVDASGYVDMLPRTLTSLARDGAGNLNVGFTSGQVAKYIPGSHIVIQGASPSDLNGTYTVSSVSFTQQTATITGGTISLQSGAGITEYLVSTTTSSAPTFSAGSFIKISGATTALLNGSWTVSSVSGTGFTFVVSSVTYPAWLATGSTIASGGTAATSLSLVAAAAGSSESATIPGTATFVRPATLGCDQNTAGVCNGDAWGGGPNTTGVWNFTQTSCSFNLQDCHDNLHGGIISDTVDGFYSNGNQGASIKIGDAGSVTVKNAILGVNCSANLAVNPDFPADYNQFLGGNCRANDGLVVHTFSWGSYIFSNLSFEDTQPTAIDDFCDAGNCSSPFPMAQYIMQNFLMEGFLDANNPGYNGSLPAIYLAEYPTSGNPNALWSWNNNMATTSLRNPPSGGANNHWTTDPLVTLAVPNITNIAGEINAVNWNLTLTGTSPAIGAGIHNAFTPTLDYLGATRPNPPSIGAYDVVIAAHPLSIGAGLFVGTGLVLGQ